MESKLFSKAPAAASSTPPYTWKDFRRLGERASTGLRRVDVELALTPLLHRKRRPTRPHEDYRFINSNLRDGTAGAEKSARSSGGMRGCKKTASSPENSLTLKRTQANRQTLKHRKCAELRL